MKVKLNLKQVLRIRVLFLLPVLFFLIKQLWLTAQSYRDCAPNPKACIVDPWGNDFISNYGKRYTEINQFLSNPTRMGYYGEPGEIFMGMGANNFVLSQYFMAPHVLDYNKEMDTILYNLYGSQNPANIAPQFLQQGWTVWKDFNNGLIILTKNK